MEKTTYRSRSRPTSRNNGMIHHTAAQRQYTASYWNTATQTPNNPPALTVNTINNIISSYIIIRSPGTMVPEGLVFYQGTDVY